MSPVLFGAIRSLVFLLLESQSLVLPPTSKRFHGRSSCTRVINKSLMHKENVIETSPLESCTKPSFAVLTSIRVLDSICLYILAKLVGEVQFPVAR